MITKNLIICSYFLPDQNSTDICELDKKSGSVVVIISCHVSPWVEYAPVPRMAQSVLINRNHEEPNAHSTVTVWHSSIKKLSCSISDYYGYATLWLSRYVASLKQENYQFEFFKHFIKH